MPKPDVQILVCTNQRPEGADKPCCASRGSLALVNAFKDAIKDGGLKDRVLVTKTGCLKHCSRGIAVAVWPQNHWYGGVGRDDVAELLAASLSGVEVERLRMPPGDWE
jgi:(2Fe-2S) ferredoxin